MVKIQKNYKNDSYENKENQQKKINLPSIAQFTLETLQSFQYKHNYRI